MREFCCEKFKSYYDSPTDRIVFPRIVILKDTGHKSLSYGSFRVLFVCGNQLSPPPFINIRYCPFCGEDALIYYSDNSYINEQYSSIFK